MTSKSNGKGKENNINSDFLSDLNIETHSPLTIRQHLPPISEIGVKEWRRRYNIIYKKTEKYKQYKKRYYSDNPKLLSKYVLKNKDKDRYKWNARKRAFDRNLRGEICSNCSSKENLQFHHTDYRKDKGFTLCKKCHTKVHYG
ncbi:MAG: HNH endonuclease signature motif containing protein [Nanoarchaeota archaeon]